MNVLERTEKVNTLLLKVRAHCMCFELIENATDYTVIYPSGFYPNGIKSTTYDGKAKALEALLHEMEKHWLSSFERGC